MWHKTNKRLYHKEQAAVADAQPGMSLEVREPGFRINQALILKHERAVVAGTYSLKVPGTGFHDYRITVIPADNHPVLPAILYCDDPKLPMGILDRHILTDGQACLALPGELRYRWVPEYGLTGFLNDFVAPFLAWQVFYDAHGKPPPWGQRAHGAQGIFDFYAELLAVVADPRVLLGFVAMMARKNPVKGHELCPCNSGRKLRDCHGLALGNARCIHPWQAAVADLAVLARMNEEGSDQENGKTQIWDQK